MDIKYKVYTEFTDVFNKKRAVGDIVFYPDSYGSRLVESGYLIKLSPDNLNIEQRISLVEKVIPSIDPQIKLTPEGGLAVRMVNKTGANSIKGSVVGVYNDSAIDNAVKNIVVNIPDPIGVMYENGVSDGFDVWVVVSGIAEVLFIGDTTRGYLARGFVGSDSGYISGYAISEALPTSPFATDKHFYEIGHVIESRVGAGLAKCIVHFN